MQKLTNGQIITLNNLTAEKIAKGQRPFYKDENLDRFFEEIC